jgi:hypothetical protein
VEVNVAYGRARSGIKMPPYVVAFAAFAAAQFIRAGFKLQEFADSPRLRGVTLGRSWTFRDEITKRFYERKSLSALHSISTLCNR